MKRKRTHECLSDTLLCMCATLEPIALPFDEIIAARDFSGLPYKIFISKEALRRSRDLAHYMVSTRTSFSGRRSFIDESGHLIAIDYNTEPIYKESVWYYEGDAYLLEERFLIEQIPQES